MGETESLDIPTSWQSSADKILQKQWRKILVIGATDRGKSTYCRFLIQRLCAAGHRVAFVDADIGQKDIGPPATISLTYLKVGLELSQAKLAGLYFVGTITPVGHLLPMTVGTRHLAETARAPFVIINTTGLVQGSGRILKAFQIESLQPKVIVTLERGRELDSVVKAYRHYHCIRLRPSPKASAKSSEARKAAREQAFRSYFEGSHETCVNLKQLHFQRCLLFNGQRLEDPRFIYAEKTSEGIIAVAKSPPSKDLPRIQVLSVGFEKNLLCGLADRRGEGIGLAIVKAIDFKQSALHLITPVSTKKIRIVQFGVLYVQPDGRELERQSKVNF